jgi:hypothetical protein
MPAWLSWGSACCCPLGSVCSQCTGDWAHGRRLYQMPSDAVGALRCAVQTMRAATSSRAALVLHHGENAACSAPIHKAVSLSRTAILAPPGRPRLKHMRPIIPAGVEHGLKPAATSNLLPACAALWMAAWATGAGSASLCISYLSACVRAHALGAWASRGVRVVPVVEQYACRWASCDTSTNKKSKTCWLKWDRKGTETQQCRQGGAAILV